MAKRTGAGDRGVIGGKKRENRGDGDRHQGRGQRQLQGFPDQRQLDRQAIAPPGQRPFGLHIGEQVAGAQGRNGLCHIVKEVGQRVPDSQQIKFRGAAGGKIERQQQQRPADGIALLPRAYLLVIAFKFGVGCLHASGIFNVAPPLTLGQAGGVEAGLTRAHQLAFHINNLLEVSHAARADVLSTAHRFDKAGVILGVQLFHCRHDLRLKVRRQRIAHRGSGRSGSAAIAR